MKPELLTSSFLPALILFELSMKLCVTLTLSIIYLTLVYTVEYPRKIHSTYLFINHHFSCGNISDNSKNAGYNQIFMAKEDILKTTIDILVYMSGLSWLLV